MVQSNKVNIKDIGSVLFEPSTKAKRLTVSIRFFKDVRVAVPQGVSLKKAVLRELIKAEQARGSDSIRLANALSALYPVGSEEKRLLDAMLLAGFR